MPTTSLGDIPRAVLRHRGKALLTFMVAVGVALALILLLPRSYRSESKLFIRLGKENALLASTDTLSQDPVVAMPPSRESEINSVVEILQSRGIAEKVVDQLGPAFILQQRSQSPAPQVSRASAAGLGDWARNLLGADPLGQRDRAVNELLTSYVVTPARKSDIVIVACEGRSPRWTQKVVACIVETYLDAHIRLHRPPGSQRFFEEQASRLRESLRRKEEELRDLKTATGLASAVDQRQILLNRIARLQDELLQAESARVASQSRVASLREELAELPARLVESEVSGVGNEGTDQMRAQLYALQTKREEGMAKYTADHPAMREIEDQLRRCEEALARQEATRTHVTTASNRLHQDIHLTLLQEEPNLASLQAQAGTLAEQLTAARGQLATLNESELQIAVLEREVEMLQSDYRKYATNLEQAKIKQAMESQRMSNISVAEPATYEPKAVAPRKVVLLGLGLAAGLFGGVGVALLAQWRDPYVRTPEDVERILGVAVLGDVPRWPPALRGLIATRRNGVEEKVRA